MKACLFYLTLFAIGNSIQAGRFSARIRKPEGYCTFRGYVPGGNKITVERIVAPEAKMQKNVFSGLAGSLGKASAGAQQAARVHG